MNKLSSFFHRVIFMAIITSMSLFANSQTFEEFYHTNLDDCATDALQLTNGNFLIAISRGDLYTNFTDFMLLKLDASGNMIDSLVYPGLMGYNYYLVDNLFSINDSVFVVSRVCVDDSMKFHLNFIKLNSQFDVLLDTIVGNMSNPAIFDYVLTEENKIATTLTEIDNFSFDLSIYDLTQNTYSYHTIIDTGGIAYHWPIAINYISQKNKYQVFMFDYDKSIHEINKTTFLIDTTYHYSPYNFMPRKAVKSFTDSTFFVAGRCSDVSSGEVRFIPTFFEIDFNGNILDYHEFDLQNDTSTYFVPKCFVTANDKIYFAVTYNYTSLPPYTIIPEQRWIWLMCLNSEGNLEWQRFYKGDVNYMPFKLLTTADNGLLIVSNKYDWNDPVPYQRDVHILKVDSTGWYEGIPTGIDHSEKPKQILVYPNPFNNEVNFVLGLYSNLLLEIYNTNGFLIHSTMLRHTEKIDLSGLPKGLYTYLLQGENGFFERGKLIKQ